jgi:tetratricopeptide (TPR) repeat protein
VLVLVALNEFGSRTVEYQIEIIRRQPTTRVRTIQVPLIDASEETESWAAAAPYVVSLKGTGFSYRLDGMQRQQAKLQMVRLVPRVLDWNEKLRASGGLLKFGILDSDEHYLLPGGEAQLLRLADERRVIVLHHGSLRSRQIDSSSKEDWTIVAADWLQIDGDGAADVVVQIPRNATHRALVHVLRGTVQIRVKHPFLEPDIFGELSAEERAAEQKLMAEKAEQSVVVVAGSRVRLLRNGFHEHRVQPLLAKSTEKILDRITPGLWRLLPKVDGRADQDNPYLKVASLVSEEQRSAWATKAAAAVQAGDSLLALNYLRYVAPDQRQANWHFLAGRAFQLLQLGERSVFHFRQALKQDPDFSGVAYYAGRLLVERRRWSQGRKLLEQALSQNPDMPDLGYYYLGIAAYAQSDWRQARLWLQQAQRQTIDDNLRSSSQAILEELELHRQNLAHAGLDLVYDTHIFGMADEDPLSAQGEDLSLGGIGYYGYAAAERWWNAGEYRDWGLIGHVSRLGWSTPALQQADLVEQAVAGGVRFGRNWRSELRLRLETLVVGKERALDGGGLDFRIQARHWPAKPYLRLRWRQFVDPLPGQADLLDPLSGEWQGTSSDRSSALQEVWLGGELNLGWHWRTEMLVFIWLRRFTNAVVARQNERRLGFRNQWSRNLSADWHWQLAWSVAQHRRPDSSDQRQDQLSAVQASVQYRWLDQWQWVSDAIIRQQTSSLERYQFQQFWLQSGMQYQF